MIVQSWSIINEGKFRGFFVVVVFKGSKEIEYFFLKPNIFYIITIHIIVLVREPERLSKINNLGDSL